MGKTLRSKRFGIRCEKIAIVGLCLFTYFSLFIFYANNNIYGLPKDYKVVNGTAEFHAQANTLTINASDKAIVNYGSFDIAAHEKVVVNLPTSASEILNRVNSPNPTQIHGMLTCNGYCILVNESGIYVAPTATINAAGLILSTRDITNQNFIDGNHLFQKISQRQLDLLLLNEGTINIEEGGFGVLIAGAVENKGIITARAGTIALAGGDAVRIEFDGGSLISVALSQPVAEQVVDYQGNPVTDQIKNTGTLSADGGTIILAASSINDIFRRSINLQGVVSANRAEEKDGVIRIVADGAVNIGGQIEVSEITVEDIRPDRPVTIGPGIDILPVHIPETAPTTVTIEQYARVKAEEIIRIVARGTIEIEATIEAPTVTLVSGGDINTRDLAIIQANNLTMTAKRFGALSTPVRVDAQNLHVRRLDGIIDIREMLGIGESIWIRGPP